MNKKEKAISFALIGIQTIEFAIIREAFSENAEIELGINAEFGMKSIAEKEIKCSPEICFLQNNIPFLKIKAACYFSVDEVAWNGYVSEDKQTITFPKGFTDHLLMLTFGTLRGILHAKTEGTIFNKFILPTINVVNLYDGDIVMKIDGD